MKRAFWPIVIIGMSFLTGFLTRDEMAERPVDLQLTYHAPELPTDGTASTSYPEPPEYYTTCDKDGASCVLQPTHTTGGAIIIPAKNQPLLQRITGNYVEHGASCQASAFPERSHWVVIHDGERRQFATFKEAKELVNQICK